MPKFMNGIENSTAPSRSQVIVRPAIARSASCLTSSPIMPFQFPFASFTFKLDFIVKILEWNGEKNLLVTSCSELIVLNYSKLIGKINNFGQLLGQINAIAHVAIVAGQISFLIAFDHEKRFVLDSKNICCCY